MADNFIGKVETLRQTGVISELDFKELGREKVSGYSNDWYVTSASTTVTATGKELLGIGKGESKQKAKQEAYKVLHGKINNPQPQRSQPQQGGSSTTQTTTPDSNSTDYISKLKQYCDKEKLPEPEYKVVSESKNPVSFNMSCALVKCGTKGYGDATTKKSAKQNAAKEVCRKKGILGLPKPLSATAPAQLAATKQSSVSLRPGPTGTGNQNQRANVSAPPSQLPNRKPARDTSVLKIPGAKLVKEFIWYFEKIDLSEGSKASSSAKVYKGKFLHGTKASPPLDVAVKVISKDQDPELSEINTMSKLFHENVIRYYFCEQDPKTDDFYLAMELAKQTLEDVVQNSYDYVPIKKILRQAAQGLFYLHEEKIVHRDIKPSNILVTANGVGKLADFGISKQLDQDRLVATTNPATGTPMWLPPEAFWAVDKKEKFHIKSSCDIFSFGAVMFYALAKGKHPFDHKENGCSYHIVAKIKEKEKPPRWEHLKQDNIKESFAAASVLEGMLMKDPTKRIPNIQLVLDHPFFWKDDKNLRFIKNLVSDLNNVPELGDSDRQIKKKLGEAYLRFWYKWKHENEIDWHSRLSDNVKCYLQRRSQGGTEEASGGSSKGKKKAGFKEYRKTSFRYLMEFVRDQADHYQDWRAYGLTVDGEFGDTEDSFMKYFATRIPELVVFIYLFCQDPNTRGMLLAPYYKVLEGENYKYPTLLEESPLL